MCDDKRAGQGDGLAAKRVGRAAAAATLAAVPRGVLWLTGGVLSTVLGAVVNEVVGSELVALAVGVVVAFAFGVEIEKWRTTS